MSAIARLVRRPDRDHASIIRDEITRAQAELPPELFEALVREILVELRALSRPRVRRRGMTSW